MIRRPAVLRGVFGAVFILVALFLNAWPFDFSQKINRPVELLEQSYDLSKQLNPLERTFYLLALLKNSTHIVNSQRYEQWCDEMHQAASAISDGWNRVALEKDAAEWLSTVNPIRAMQMLSQIEDPQADSDGTFPEDVRSDGAKKVFTNYWKSADSSSQMKLLPGIEGEARRLGQTGEYPYAAMGLIVEQLWQLGADKTQKDIDAIFSEALQFYKDGPQKFLNRNRMFESFLEKAASRVSDRNLAMQAIKVFVEKVLQTPKDMDFQGEVQNKKSKEAVWVTDDRVYLLFQAFPMIYKLAPPASNLTDDLIQKFPELKKASKDSKDDMEFLPAGYGPPGEDSERAQKMHGKYLQASVINEIKKKVQDHDLKNAQALAAQLTDDASHVEGFTALVPALISDTPDKAKQIYYGERTRLQEIRDRDEYLRAVVALIETSFDVQDRDGLANLASTGLEQGAILFEEDSRQRPQWTPSERRGYKDLSKIVTFGASRGVDALPDQIQQLQNVELKAHLLTFEAKAIADAQAKH